VKRSAAPVAATPASVVTSTSTAPGFVAGGETAVTWVSESTEKLRAETAPKLTAVAPSRSWPEMTTRLPPPIGPRAGLSPPTSGAAGRRR
jgi:hypothetical protein